MQGGKLCKEGYTVRWDLAKKKDFEIWSSTGIMNECTGCLHWTEESKAHNKLSPFVLALPIKSKPCQSQVDAQ